jgi:hypothetical protein
LQRTKKRRWKAACAASDGEVAALHGRLVARQGEIDALERRVEALETEVSRGSYRRYRREGPFPSNRVCTTVESSPRQVDAAPSSHQSNRQPQLLLLGASAHVRVVVRQPTMSQQQQQEGGDAGGLFDGVGDVGLDGCEGGGEAMDVPEARRMVESAMDGEGAAV